MRAAFQLLRLVRAGRRAQDEMERILRVDGQAANLGTPGLERARYGAGFGAVSVQREAL